MFYVSSSQDVEVLFFSCVFFFQRYSVLFFLFCFNRRVFNASRAMFSRVFCFIVYLFFVLKKSVSSPTAFLYAPPEESPDESDSTKSAGRKDAEKVPENQRFHSVPAPEMSTAAGYSRMGDVSVVYVGYS